MMVVLGERIRIVSANVLACGGAHVADAYLVGFCVAREKSVAMIEL